MKELWKKRGLSVLLAVLLSFVSAVQFALPVRAEGEPVVETGITYELDDQGGYVGFVLPDLEETSINIPSGCLLLIGDEAEGNTLAGSTVSIEPGGKLGLFAPFEGSLNPSDGALLFGGPDNVPAGLTLYEADAETEFGDWDNIWSHTFCYIADPGKWVDLPGDPLVDVNLGGFDPDTDEVTIEYKYTGEDDYRSVDDYEPWEDPEFEGNFSGSFMLRDIPEDWDNLVHIKVTFESERSAVILAADNETGDLSAGINSEGSEFAVTITFDECHWIGISLGYPNSGDPAITEKADNYLYAYCPTDGKTVEELFAEELICRLMDPSLFECFGMPEITGSDAGQSATRVANVATLQSRIEASGSSYQVTAMDTNGAPHNITVQDYTVNWGVSFNDGTPVASTLPVYTLEDIGQVLICTDFNDETGRGSEFLICNITTDEIEFSEGGQQAARSVRFAVDSINASTIKSGGMGRMENVINDEGIYTIEVNGGAPASFLRVTDPVQGAMMIRLLKASDNYLAIGGEGEPKEYGLIGDNGRHVDRVWATGADGTAVARVYVGYNIIHLYPLNDASGVTGTDILSVELEDATQEDGVTLDASDPSDITLTFTSNFYDEIPLIITFEGNQTRHLTVIRVGLVIQYEYLRDNSNSANPNGDHGEIILDYQNTSIPFDYDYFAGEQIAVWATYYHPSNDNTTGANDYVLYLTFGDNTHRVVTPDDTLHGFNGRVPETGSAVASTTFLIGFEQSADHFDDVGQVWVGSLNETDYHEGGFYATVLNEGFDDPTTYGGTQMGSGRGVHWDGHISFYR